MLITLKSVLAALTVASPAISSAASNHTRYNPAIPGWYSDPSCVLVAERDNTTFCTSSTFLLTPGLPVHASKDLSSWKLASHAISLKSQYPQYDQSLAHIDGIWAATIRYHQGTFYIITIYRKASVDSRLNQGLIFKTTDPYNDQAWSDPIQYDAKSIDPDLFWDDDGTTYVATAGTYLQIVDLETGTFSEPRQISNGTNARGQWWATALSWRSGPEAKNYPTGREMVITPATWGNGSWPVISPIRGVESGWYLPPSRDLPGDGPFVDEGDVVEFEPNSAIPRHFGFWRWPDTAAYAVSPPGHPNTLRLTPSAMSITAGYENYTAGYDIGNFILVMRLQTDTMFQYSVDMSYIPQVADEEAGVTVFLNQGPLNITNSPLVPHFRFLVSGLGSHLEDIPAPSTMPIPKFWLQDPIRLIIRSTNEMHYVLSAASSLYPSEEYVIGTAPATVVSGGDGPFTGSLVGTYATNNGGNGTTPAYVSRWRYQGLAQSIDNGEMVPSRFIYQNLALSDQ
ncbi:hypothetical protein BS50DRAFT_605443 [Corynespora cassiicola Philippines]|uniref:Beta-xylosidase C-terminal Concanavalin A-like domain-containing protein n=1 Tax=Corynespora cassiicola Philippines TaxID=1448308 RepID=A0A2T2N0L7_CORCC|nr:hypothetical protein BS50DRAFT_605443 [Corynespora cassiicola Philippines]